VGKATVGAVSNSDYPLVQGVNVFFIAIVMAMNLIVDVSYGYLDPRIRYR
jgi:peptide/nickel transport system permease protein